jgi:autotransporter-associated beta strand protein
VSRHFNLSADAGNTSLWQHNGGVLAAGRIINGAGTSVVNFNGGAVRALRDELDFFSNFNPAMSEIQAGGLIVDSNGFTITAQNALDGPGALTKTGAGTLSLSGNNSYAGATNISAGTLLMGASNVLPDASPVNLSPNATLATGGNSDTLGPLSLLGSAVIDMGPGSTSTLTFADVASWTGILNIWNYNGAVWQLGADKLIFNAGSGNVLLSDVRFYSDNGLTRIDSTGGGFIGSELVPVPETSATLAGLLLLGLAAKREGLGRRRR